MEIIDKSSLFKIAYGLYVITMNDGSRDNGMISAAGRRRHQQGQLLP